MPAALNVCVQPGEATLSRLSTLVTVCARARLTRKKESMESRYIDIACA